MVEAGLYGVARVYGAVFSAAGIESQVHSVLLCAGILTCLAGAILCSRSGI